jgi:uncharacterized lipoprotein
MKILSTLSVTALVLVLAACDSNTTDKVSNKAQEAYETSKEMAKDAGSQIKDTADEVGDKMKEPFQSPAEEVGEQIEDGIDAVKE